MKPIASALFIFFFTICAQAQSPDAFVWQAELRGGDNTLLTNITVGARLSVVQSSGTVTAIYSETHTATTNSNGLLSVTLGEGIPVSGDFNDIDWRAGPYSIRLEADPSGGNNYSISQEQVLSAVPYAFHAKKVYVSASQIGDTLKIGAHGKMVIPGLTEANFGPPAYSGPDYQDSVVFCGDRPTDVVEVINPITGYTWMDRNLGASIAATSSTNARAFGDLFQWGRFPDGHQCRESDTISMVASSPSPNSQDPWYGRFIAGDTNLLWTLAFDSTLWEGQNAANNPCPDGYRLPTIAEWDNERESWVNNQAVGAFASPLKLPFSGSRENDGETLASDEHGSYYWSGSISENQRVWALFFDGEDALTEAIVPAKGAAVRCVKDVPPMPYFCEGIQTITSTSGVVADGSAADDYGPNANCQWLIQPDGASQVTLQFSEFSLENGNDSVIIYDGASPESPILGAFTGSTLPPLVTSSSNSMLIFFLSNGTVQSSGWSATYSGVQTYCSGTDTLTTSTGFLTDGSEEGNYENNTDCRWLIQPVGATTITLTFSSFNLEAGYDYLRVYNGTSDSDSLLATISGSTLPQNISATGGSMYIRFTTDGSVVRSGWEATYSAEIASGPEVISCIDTLYDASGVISDGSGDENYEANSDCSWLIQPHNARTITLSFSNFDLEPCCDFVSVYNGSTASDSLLGAFTGTSIPNDITTTGGVMFVQFVSDASIERSGWEAAFSSSSYYGSDYVHCEDPTIVASVTNPSTGKIWMDRNLGAKSVPKSALDTEGFGSLYQWGRFADGHQCRNSQISNDNATSYRGNPGDIWYGKFIVESNDSLDWLSFQMDSLWLGGQAVNNPCPIGFRLPTTAEWDAERQSWGENTLEGGYDSVLKLPAAGTRLASDGSFDLVGPFGNYWSGTAHGTKGMMLSIHSEAEIASDFRASGNAVRCIRY